MLTAGAKLSPKFATTMPPSVTAYQTNLQLHSMRWRVRLVDSKSLHEEIHFHFESIQGDRNKSITNLPL
jgi:hypothetical protein